jgi:hypothetical protein
MRTFQINVVNFNEVCILYRVGVTQYRDYGTGWTTVVPFPEGEGTDFSSPPRPDGVFGPAEPAIQWISDLPRGKAAGA